jgi:polysaccharide export outer membrane protein
MAQGEDLTWIRLGGRGRTLRGIAPIIAVSSLVVACAAPPPPPPVEVVPGERDPYVIGVMDVLTIAVWKNPELTVPARVRPDGMISVPLLDDVQAEGLTPQELKEVLTEALAEFISNPDVTVLVQEMNSRMIFLMGEGIARNGALSLQSEMRVLEAIATMGGFTVWAKKNRVKILRKSPTGIVQYEFDYGAYLAGKAPDSNIVLQPGDTIVIEN